MTINYSSDLEYARDKLVGSFIAYEQDLVIVRDISNDGIVYLKKLASEENFETTFDKINLEPPELGYVNIDKKSLYAQRVPKRKYRQGFRSDTLVIKGNLYGANIKKELNNTFRKIFPSIDNCIEQIYNGEAISRAFCNKFSLDRGGSKDIMDLYYKGKLTGNLLVKKDEFVLLNKYLFLNEVLEECL